jgi:hypothetical protein
VVAKLGNVDPVQSHRTLPIVARGSVNLQYSQGHFVSWASQTPIPNIGIFSQYSGS